MRGLSARRPAAPRTRRGLPWREASYASLDFETTGLDYAADHIVSFGVVPIERGRVLVGASTTQLVRSPVPPSPRSQTIHLLRPMDLADAPDVETATATLRAALTRRFVLAWFAEVEVAFLRRLFGGSARSWRRRVIDVRDLAIAVDGAPAGARRERGYALTPTAARFGVPVDDPHDALGDALVTAQLFLVLVGKMPGRPAPSARELTSLHSSLT
jgi:DNA polymerase-3 subunit epsilon